MNFICLFLGASFLFYSSAAFSYFTIGGEGRFHATIAGTGLKLEGETAIFNTGDEMANNVFPELKLGDRFRWAGEPVNIEPGQKHSWKVSGLIPSWNAKQKGVFAVLIRRHYQDGNGYQFSAPAIVTVEVGLNPEQRAQLLESHLDQKLSVLSGNGQSFDGMLELSNLDRVGHLAKLTVFTTGQVRVEPEYQSVMLQPAENKTVSLKINNHTALSGSNYPIFTVVEWDDAAIHHISLSEDMIRITEKNALFGSQPRMWVIIISMAIALVAIGFLAFGKLSPFKLSDQ